MPPSCSIPLVDSQHRPNIALSLSSSSDDLSLFKEKKRMVLFSDAVEEIHHSPLEQEYDKSARWYSRDEYASFRLQNQETIAAARTGTLGDNDCTRGLERFISAQVLEHRRQQRARTIHFILQEQEKQVKSSGQRNDRILASLSELCTKKERDQAIAQAALDAVHVASSLWVYDEDEDSARSSSPSPRRVVAVFEPSYTESINAMTSTWTRADPFVQDHKGTEKPEQLLCTARQQAQATSRHRGRQHKKQPKKSLLCNVTLPRNLDNLGRRVFCYSSVSAKATC